MKIRLSTQGMSLNVEVPETKAIMVYRGLAEKLLIHACAQETQMPKTVLQPKIVVNPPMPPEAIKPPTEAETQENPILPETEDEKETDTAIFWRKKQLRCLEVYQQKLQAIPGVVDVIKQLTEKQIPICKKAVLS